MSSLHHTTINPPVRLPEADSDVILGHLTSQQHVHPHMPIREVIDETTQTFGCCPQAIERAMQWLQIDGTRPIGRLRRGELVQLARAVYRFWSQNLNAPSAATP